MAVTTSAPTTHDEVEEAFVKAYEFFESCKEQGADLAMARVKLGEAERTFEQAGGEFKQVMLDLTPKLLGTAKRMAYNALLQAAVRKLAQAEEYQAQGYHCPRAEELFQPIRWAIQDDDAFGANYKASLAVRLYEQTIADIANSERTTTARAQLTAARARAKKNHEEKQIDNRKRALAQGAHTKQR